MNETELYIKRNEGIRYRLYRCPAGKASIGWGRNLQDNGISRDEAEYLFKNDFNRAVQSVRDLVPNLDNLTCNRQTVLVDMAFNLGRGRFEGFKNMLQAVRDGNYERAADEIDNSLYRRQLPDRAAANSKMMRDG